MLGRRDRGKNFLVSLEVFLLSRSKKCEEGEGGYRSRLWVSSIDLGGTS